MPPKTKSKKNKNTTQFLEEKILLYTDINDKNTW